MSEVPPKSGSGVPEPEGVVKFRSVHEQTEPMWNDVPPELIRCRNRLRQVELIGVYPDGIGFGNVSRRSGEGRFFISGTGSGDVEHADARHFSLVLVADIERNSITSRGPVPASSESLTHAALYRCDPAVRLIIHVHSGEAWERLFGNVPTSDADVPYGTPEMAGEIRLLYRETDLPEHRIMVMGGHPEGIIAFGSNAAEALEPLIALHVRGLKGKAPDVTGRKS